MAAPPYYLPPGVYFKPSHEECVRDYLRPWIASGCPGVEPLHDSVFPMDVYRRRPDELQRMFPPGHARGADRWWYFLTLLRMSVAGRGKRLVATGGYWKIEQKSKKLQNGDCGGGGGKRQSFGFYLREGVKSAWLMEQMMAVDGDGDGDGKGKGISEGEEIVPVICRIYVSPRTDNEDRREILGDEGVVAVDREGKPMPVCVTVGDEYFDMLAARLPASCVRRARHAGGHHVAAAPPGGFGNQMQASQVAPPQPPEFISHHNFQDALPPDLLQGHQQGQAAPPPAVHGHYEQYYVQNAGFYDAPPPPAAVHGDHQHYSVQNAVGFYDSPPPPPAVHDDHQHYYVQNAVGFYDAPPPPMPPIHVPNPPQQEEDVEEMHRVEKRQRLTYETPAQGPVATNSTNHETQQAPETTPAQEAPDASDVDAAAVKELVAPPAPTPPQEEEMIPDSGTPSPPPPVSDDNVSPPQLPPTGIDAVFQHDATNKDPPSSSGSTDLSNLTHDSFGNDFGLTCPTLDDEGQPVDTSRLQNILQYDFDDFDPSWIDVGFGPSLQATPQTG